MSSVSEVLKRAREFEKKGEWDEAAIEYKQLEQDGNAPPLVYNLLGDLNHKRGAQEEAHEWYQKAIDRYASDGLYANAIGICRKALRQDRERLDVLQRLGWLFESQGLTREAVNHYLLFASSMARRGGLEAVLDAARKIREIFPEDPKTREKLGQLFHTLGADDEAVVEFEAAVISYRSQGRGDDAERVGRAVADLGGNIAEVGHDSEALSQDAPGTGTGGRTDRDTAGDAPTEEPTSFHMANGIEATVEPSVSVETIASDDATAMPQEHFGMIGGEEAATDDDEPQSSKKTLHGAHEDGDLVPVHEILREFQNGVDQILDEDDFESHYDMGMSYKEMGLYDEALGEFEIAGGSAERHTACLEMRAAILIELGRHEEGMAIIKDLIEAKEENRAGGHYLMGVAYEKQGETKLALEEYRIVESLDPEFRNVRERIEQVGG